MPLHRMLIPRLIRHTYSISMVYARLCNSLTVSAERDAIPSWLMEMSLALLQTPVMIESPS